MIRWHLSFSDDGKIGIAAHPSLIEKIRSGLLRDGIKSQPISGTITVSTLTESASMELFAETSVHENDVFKSVWNSTQGGMVG